MKKLLVLSLLAASACTTKPLERYIPTQDGHNLHSTRSAMESCIGETSEGGNAAVVGGYMTSILIAGVVIGPLVTIPAEDSLRAQGEIDQVHRCLAERGFKRRELADGEVFWLNNSFGDERERRLGHLIGGGTIETYGN
ncbi:hypothetical protein [Ruegeria arenilitoris]|uniref:hypothetical protein n=1 Tax=Ruegeria arenilitoris TaxID=1173585 RepID=UPI00147CD753|nr:hypothetical protein [Ruegeria arenilitoris]